MRSPELKRCLDVAGASVGLVLAAPIMAAAAVAIAVDMGRPVLFRQKRPGKDGEVFELLKFRTMRDAVDAQGRPLPDGERLTRLGRFLRASSIDELPELVNILRGDMSLVGPRPLLVAYLERYDARQARRHDVRPGLTGWAQIHGRNASSWQARFEHDVWYVENWSNELDLWILARTVVSVVRREGISEAGEATRSPFMGNPA